MHKRWIFGEKGCELYAFCGALFGICSMITLMVIAIDRYFVITHPLTSIGVLTRKRALLILMLVWVYSMGWSLPPFFGWSAYVPEGLLTSCTWDYMTFTPSVRAYTMLLFIFVFFLPLFIIIYCYVFIYRAIRTTNRAVGKISGSTHSHSSTRDTVKSFHRLQNEWKMAKIALIVILLYVISWSPYSSVALTAFAGYADMLTPYMNSVPAVIAKASAIHNPIIYAITHPKYRIALAKYIPCLGVLLCVRLRDLRSTSSSFVSTRRSTVTSQSSDISSQYRRQSTAKSRLSSVSDSESGLTDTEADLSSLGSRPASRQVSCDISRDTAELPNFKHSSSFKSKLKNLDSGIFEKVNFCQSDRVSSRSGVTVRHLGHTGDVSDGHVMRGQIGRIPSIVITSETSPFLSIGRNGSRTTRAKASHNNTGAPVNENPCNTPHPAAGPPASSPRPPSGSVAGSRDQSRIPDHRRPIQASRYHASTQFLLIYPVSSRLILTASTSSSSGTKWLRPSGSQLLPPPAEAAAVHGSRRICNSGSGRFLTGFFGVFADFCTRTGPAGRS
ncbi:Melanopsin-A [Goodea atripinnis]|uniref:Melanopsin-A n=1 Tax=Goodea atripinnis TaxID=208336 RepID=A0ABV0Q013_9TELE